MFGALTHFINNSEGRITHCEPAITPLSAQLWHPLQIVQNVAISVKHTVQNCLQRFHLDSFRSCRVCQVTVENIYWWAWKPLKRGSGFHNHAGSFRIIYRFFSWDKCLPYLDTQFLLMLGQCMEHMWVLWTECWYYILTLHFPKVSTVPIVEKEEFHMQKGFFAH